jgi:hypothetical protein
MHITYLAGAGTGAKSSPLPKNARANSDEATLSGAHDSQRVLVARLYARCIDRWPMLSDAKRARRLQPSAARRGHGLFLTRQSRSTGTYALVDCHGCPTQVRTDNGPEFISPV